jgi:hypothetical protein
MKSQRKVLLVGLVSALGVVGLAGNAQAQAVAVTPAPAPPTIVHAPPPAGQPYYAPPGTVVYPGGQPYYPPNQPPPGYAPQPQYPPQGYAQPYPPQGYMPGSQPQPQPPIRYEYRRPNTAMLIAGVAILGGGYLLTALPTALWNSLDTGVSTATNSGTHGTYWPLYIPVLGPWIELSYLNSNPFYKGWGILVGIPTVMSGLVQGTGLALTIAGAVTGRRVPVNDAQASNFTIAPYTLPGGGGGLAASGRF